MPPEEYVIASMCERNGGLPFAGGVLEQPNRLMTLGPYLLDYARALSVYERDGDKAPQAVKAWVLRTMAASVA